MPPIRRYLRITPHSVLETRIYLTDPYQLPWLLSVSSATGVSVLQRITTAVRPHVFRQLREERARQFAKTSRKKKGIKDVAFDEDFEVSVYLTDGGTRHNLLVKQKGFGEGGKMRGVKRRKGKNGKLTGWLEGSKEAPVEVEGEETVAGVRIREESDDEEDAGAKLRQYEEISDDEGFERTQARHNTEDIENNVDDKKKLAMDLNYDGFAIYGKVLCLVVKRKGPGAERKVAGIGGGASMVGTSEQAGRAMLEDWVSTQAQAQADGENTLIED